MESYFTQYVMVHYCPYFDVQIVQDSSSRDPSSWLLCPFDMSQLFLTFWHKMFQAYLVPPLLQF